MDWSRIYRILKWSAVVIAGMMLLMSALILVFKDNIKSYALTEANNFLNKKVHVSYVDVGIWKTFPSMTITLDDVLIHSRFDTIQTIDTAIYAQNIQLRFNPLDFFKKDYNVKRIDINNGVVNLAVNEAGLVNYDLIKASEEASNTPFEFNLKKINFTNTDFSYTDAMLQQYYAAFFKDLKLDGSFNEKQFILNASTNFDIQKIRSKSLDLIENQSAKCKISIQMDQINDVFEIVNADLAINKLPFAIHGKVSQDSLNFYIGSKNIDLASFTHHFALQELSVVDNINGKGLVDFELFIQGERAVASGPAIFADFEVRNGSLSDQGFALSKINLKGSYSNGVKDQYEHLSLHQLEFVSLGEQFNGRVKVTNFEQPRLNGFAKGMIDLQAIHRIFGPFGLQYISGNIKVDSDFDIQFNHAPFSLNTLHVNNWRGALTFHNITAQLLEDTRVLRIPNGGLNFRNQYAKVSDLSLLLNESSLHLDGEVRNMVDYFNGSGAVWINAQLKSDKLVIDDLSGGGESAETTVRSWVLPTQVRGQVEANLERVIYSGHHYNSISGQISFSDHSLNFPHISGVVSGAKVSGNLHLTEERPMVLNLETNLKANKVNFQPIFKEWKNFEQSVITAENIDGQADVKLYLKLPFDLYKQEILKSEIQANTQVSIRNGALKNVETFKEITQSLRSSAAKLLISKNRINAFEKKLLHLQFDTFENEFRIQDGVLTIPQMTIRSNALDVTLAGTHSFDNLIDYSFNFRFREIKGGRESGFGDIVDDGTGFRVYLRMFGPLSAPSFQWDKEAKKQDQQERKEQARDDLKSALKTGFGINKKDSTIQGIQEDKRQEERIIIDFGKEEDIPEEKPKKKNNIFNRWQKEKEKESSEFEYELD